MTVSIVDIAPAHEAAWRRLWDRYLRFYEVRVPAEVTDFTWARMVGTASPMRGRAAVRGDEMIGFTISHLHESSWSASPSCYLEDLFVSEGSRGTGAGAALVDDLVQWARQQGCSRIFWYTDRDNATARRLYDRFTPADRVVRYTLDLRSGQTP
jgi:GNAT superfamily N-acetyltransferase